MTLGVVGEIVGERDRERLLLQPLRLRMTAALGDRSLRPQRDRKRLRVRMRLGDVERELGSLAARSRSPLNQ